ncbi:MAG: hypothetical protein WAV76_03960 [Bacteroidota bacterium]
MRKPFPSTLILFLIIFSLAYCQDKTSSNIDVDFKIPKGWKKISDSVYILKNYAKELNEWAPYLAQGHMPWRYSPKNIVVTCLWSFGITDGTPVDVFAARLNEVKSKEIYSLIVDSTNYIVYIRTKKNVPIAYKFKIRNNPNKYK